MDRTIRKRLIFGSIALGAAVPAALVYRKFRREISQAYRRISSGGRVLDTTCGPIQYAEPGEGAPMLIVHGAGGGYDQGETFARLIGGPYRWIAPSRFGFPGTPVPGGADSALQADAYACLLDALRINRAGVVGISMGGPSALQFALRHPERTRSLALISAASHAILPRPAGLAALFELFLNDFVFWSLVRLNPAALLAALGVPLEVQGQLPAGEAAQLREFLESILPMGARRQGQLLEQHMSEHDAEQIHQIQAPTLILHARDDTLVPFEQGEFAAARIPGARLAPMERGGHLALMLGMNVGAKEELRQFLEHYSTM